MNIAQKDLLALRQAAIERYNDFYTAAGKLRETDAFYQWVLDKLPTRHGKLLDVACGEGHMVRLAQRHGLVSFGADFSLQAMLTAQRIAGDHIVAVADGEELPFDSRTFDYVTNLGSLEHFVSPARGLQEMHRVVKPDGYVLLLLPNSYYWLDIVWHVWRTGYPVSHSQTIERFATFGEWRSLLEENRFVVVQAHKYNLCWPASLADLNWYARSPRKLVYPLLSPLTPFQLAYSFLFLCRPR